MRSFLSNLIQNKPDAVNINELSQFAYSDSQKFWYEQAAGGSLDGLSAEQKMALTPKAQRLMTASRPQSVFVKTHNQLATNHGVPFVTAEETVGAIYIVRNPLDVAISYANHSGISIDESIDFMNNPAADTPEDAYKMPQSYGTWSNHVTSWQKFNPRYLHFVRYEDMLLKPGKTFSGVVKFLGIKVPKNQIAKAIKQSSFKVLQNQEQKEGFSERPDSADRFFRSGKAGEWKTVLSPEQVTRIVDAHHDHMEKLGYLP
ncbi:sulfotransferase domain-containing protein [Sneathiella chinensis]|nr:sulfotransferase domain-containing protein [Sneathiella chinensis]